MSRLVAEIRRKSTLTGFLAPTGSISPSCSARSSFTCASSGSSPISSRNSVPPSASWNLPMRLSTAPVNEPFSWPNRMLSTRFSGMAPQLTVTNGSAGAFALALDGARDQLLADAAFALDQHRDVGGGGALAERDDALHGFAAHDEVAEGERAFGLLLDAGDLVLQRLDLERAVDRDLEPLGRSGLTTKSTAPARMALMAASIEPCAVCTMIGGMPGLRRDAFEHLHAVDAGHDEVEQDERDGGRVRPLEDLQGLLARPWAVLVSKPRRLIVSSRMRRWAGSSSTIRTSLAMWHSNSTQLRLLLTVRAGIDPAFEQSATQHSLGRARECPIWVNVSFRFGLR